MLKTWLMLWGALTVVVAVGLLGHADPVLILFLAGLVFWALGTLMAHLTVGRATLAGTAMFGGFWLSFFGSAVLVGLGVLSDREAAAVIPLGLIAGLQLALGGVTLAVLLLNLLVYGILCLQVAGSARAGLELAGLGSVLVLPSILLGCLERRRGEHWPADLRRGERLLKATLAVCLFAGCLYLGLTSHHFSPSTWVGFAIFSCWLHYSVFR